MKAKWTEVPNLLTGGDENLPMVFEGGVDQAVTEFLKVKKVVFNQENTIRAHMGQAEKSDPFVQSANIVRRLRIMAYRQMIDDYQFYLGLRFGDEFHEKLAELLL